MLLIVLDFGHQVPHHSYRACFACVYFLDLGSTSDCPFMEFDGLIFKILKDTVGYIE